MTGERRKGQIKKIVITPEYVAGTGQPEYIEDMKAEES